jgi:hypothetical protein
MKMLTRNGNKEYLNSLKEILEKNGIPAVIQGIETARMIIPTVIFEPSLWIYINGQLEDARNLIINPDHYVTTGIDIEEFYSSQLTEEEQSTQLNNVLASIAVYALLGILVFWVFLSLVGGT